MAIPRVECAPLIRAVVVWSGLFMLTYGQCPAGRFGHSCQPLCHCANHNPCDVITGACPGLCDRGYSGPICQTRSLHVDAKISELHPPPSPGASTYAIILRERAALNRISLRSVVKSSMGSFPDLQGLINITVSSGPCQSSASIKHGRFTVQANCNVTARMFLLALSTQLLRHLSSLTYKVLVCSEFVYGSRCNEICGHCRNGSTCDQMTGLCPDGCAAGYRGTKCDSATSNSTVGDNRGGMCGMCQDGKLCDHVTGICAGGCADGWKGDNCTQTCERGTFGKNCTFTCGFCEHGETCDPVTGNCAEGCAEGWEGERCDRRCEEGRFGRGCRQRCETCSGGESCHHVTGRCLLNRTATETANTTFSNHDADDSGNFPRLKSVLTIAGVGLAAALLLATSGIVMLWKRYAARQRNLNESENYSSVVFNPRHPDSHDYKVLRRNQSSNYDESDHIYEEVV